MTLVNCQLPTCHKNKEGKCTSENITLTPIDGNMVACLEFEETDEPVNEICANYKECTDKYTGCEQYCNAFEIDDNT